MCCETSLEAVVLALADSAEALVVVAVAVEAGLVVFGSAEALASHYLLFGSYALHKDPKSEAILCVSQYV